MTENVTLAIIDMDLKIRTIKKYPLSSAGRQIVVVNGGENHFMPKITNTSYLWLPMGPKRFLFCGKKRLKQIYFAMNKAKKCVDFASGDVSMPSPEEMKKAIENTILEQIGKNKNQLI